MDYVAYFIEIQVSEDFFMTRP